MPRRIKINPAQMATVLSIPPILLGFLVLVDWYTPNTAFIQVSTIFAPMPYNSALLFLVAGLGLISVLHFSPNIARALGSVVFIAGGLTLGEYFLGMNLGIDQFFMDHYIVVETSHPGRMAPNTALCFSLTGIALIVGGRPALTNWAFFTISLLGVLIAASGSIALLAYGASLETAYGWGQQIRMAIQTALGFLFVGGALVAFAWSRGNYENQIMPSWFTWSVGIGILAIAVSLWAALETWASSHANSLVLVFGIILAIVITVNVHITGLARKKTAAFQTVNAMLAEEIVERNEIEQQLSETKTRLERTFESLSDAVFIGDFDKRRIIDCNHAVYDIFGYAKTELVGESFKLLYADDEAFQKVGEILATALAVDNICYFKYTLRRKDTTTFPAEITITKIETAEGEQAQIVAVFRDVTAQTRAEEDLRLALVDAEQANQAKSEFLATMSHELRTPLNAILGFSDILHHQYFGPPGAGKYREYARDIHASGEHLLELVNDLLDISTIEEGKLALNIVEMEISMAIDECVDVVAEKGREKGVNMRVLISENLPLLRADRRAIRQILLNLLSNSIKFTPGGGMIEVCAEEIGKAVAFKISDTGSGIPAEMIPDLTNPFTRAEQDPYKAVEGWGLGLSITKSLVDLHDGKLDIASTVNEGTVVTVTLPNIAA